MLDWFSGYVGYDASQLELGVFFEVDKHGELVRKVPRWETARGSFEAGIQVTRGSATGAMLGAAAEAGFVCSQEVLRVSGNPSKFLQGHNVAGPSVAMLGPVLRAMVREFKDGMRPPDADARQLPSVHRSRVDVTTSVDLGTHEAVHDWLQLAAVTTRSRHGRAMDSHGTVYWGKTSRRWTLKAYCKHCELRKHLPLDLPENLLSALMEWTRPLLRIELCLRRPELEHRGTLSESLIWDFFSRVEFATMATTREPQTNLRPQAKLALRAWYNGSDLTVDLPRRTLYRYRRQILDETGVDILLPAVKQDDGAQRTLLGLEELRKREAKNLPDIVSRSLFGAGT